MPQTPRLNKRQGLYFSILALLTLFLIPKAYSADKDSLINELGGVTLIKSNIEVMGVTKLDKQLDLVEISTPSYTPASNHAFIWLLSNGTTAQALKIMFDDGTVKTIESN